MDSHYKTLGLCREFTDAELKANYRELTRKLHPDRLGGTPEANDAFAKVTCAYACLSSFDARVRYEGALALLSSPCSGCGGSGATYRQKGFTEKIKSVCVACEGSGRIADAAPARKTRTTTTKKGSK